MDGKPALFIYRADMLPDAAATARIWRKEVREAGLGELFLGAFVTREADIDGWDFDTAVEFVPCPAKQSAHRAPKRLLITLLGRISARLNGAYEASLHLYDDLIDDRLGAAPPEGTTSDRWLRCVTPSWDNSARRKKRPLIYLGSTPAKYRDWLRKIIQWSQDHNPPGQRFVFINAWNEWAEGNHLEPDRRYGHQYLEATRAAMQVAGKPRPGHWGNTNVKKSVSRPVDTRSKP